jgi:hypothetical protein
MASKDKYELIRKVVKQIELDIQDGDTQPLEILLHSVSEDELKSFLSEANEDD